MAALVDRGPPGPLRSLYVHVPFCTDRCTYCAFPTVTDRADQHGALVEGLLGELARSEVGRLATVYLGGGTPSLLAPSLLARVLAALAERGLDPDAEITLEANPGDIGPDRLAAWQDLGITRLSIGIQTFDDEALARLGRHHDGARAHQALEATGATWRGSWSADLLVGWHGQSASRLAADLDALLTHRPPHVSVYSLTLEPGTPLAQRAQNGFKGTVNTSFMDLFDRQGSAVLEGAGYERYEVSNFARPDHRSHHNQVYWRNEAYLGIGPGAASSIHPLRWINRADPASYLAAVAAGRSLRQLVERIAPLDRLVESLAVGLRTADGVARSELDRRFSPAWSELVERAGGALLEAGYLVRGPEALGIPRAHRAKTDRIVTELAQGLDRVTASPTAPSATSPASRS